MHNSFFFSLFRCSKIDAIFICVCIIERERAYFIINKNNIFHTKTIFFIFPEIIIITRIYRIITLLLINNFSKLFKKKEEKNFIIKQ